MLRILHVCHGFQLRSRQSVITISHVWCLNYFIHSLFQDFSWYISLSINLILSNFISSNLIKSNLISSYLILSYLILSYIILFCLILSYLILYYLSIYLSIYLSYHILSYLILSYLILSYLFFSYLSIDLSIDRSIYLFIYLICSFILFFSGFNPFNHVTLWYSTMTGSVLPGHLWSGLPFLGARSQEYQGGSNRGAPGIGWLPPKKNRSAEKVRKHSHGKTPAIQRVCSNGVSA